jgi:putative tricarboxylic transport membrane protein
MNGFLAPLTGAAEIFTDPLVILLVAVGTIFGVMAGSTPGLGSTLAFGLVLPFTFAMGAVPAVAFLLSISVGIGFGNSLPAILVGVPGTPAAVLTVIDGHQLHKRGESGLALGIAYLSALLGQGVSALFFVAAVIPLAALAYQFLQPEMFSLYVFGIVAIVSLTGKNIVKGFMAAALGLLVGTVGVDPVNFVPRFTFGSFELREGLNPPAVIIGLLAVSELIRQSRQAFQWNRTTGFNAKFPSFKQIRPALPGMAIGTVVGTVVGTIPGAGGTPSALISYQQAQLLSKHPEKFGHGSVEGLAANEAAQNADKSGELIPTLGLGVPGSSSMVLLLAALTMNGFIPGPNLVRDAPELLSATVVGLLGSSVVMLVCGWWISKVMLKALTINRSMVVVFALAVIVLGVYSLNYKVLDVVVCLAFGAVGYAMLRYGYSTGAAALAVVLASGLESNLRRGLGLFDNSVWAFVSRPITAVILAAAMAFFVIGLRRTIRSGREERESKDAGPQDPEPQGPEPQKVS